VKIVTFVFLVVLTGRSLAAESSACVLKGVVLESADYMEQMHVAITVESAERLEVGKLGKCTHHIGTDLEFSFSYEKENLPVGSKMQMTWLITDSGLVGYSGIKVVSEKQPYKFQNECAASGTDALLARPF